MHHRLENQGVSEGFLGLFIALLKGMKTVYGLLLGSLIFLIQACGVKKPSPEEACHFQQNSYLQRVSWSWKTPVVMYANATLDDAQKAALQKAIDIWNTTVEAKGFQRGTFFKYGGAINAPSGFNIDGKNVVSFVDNWVGTGTEQGETEINWVNDRIYEADMRINAAKSFSTNDTGEPGKYDLVALFVHELGHVLGLLHIQSSDYTTMATTLAADDVQRRTIGDIELDALKCEY